MAHRMLAESERELIRARCEAVLRQNWREGVTRQRRLARSATRCPEPWPLPVAVVLGLVLSRDRVAATLTPPAPVASWSRCSLPSATDGFIGHTIFWNQPLQGSRRYIYNVISAD